MTENDVSRKLHQAAALAVALAGALAFGILVLADEDWIPGTIIVVASLIGLAGQLATIRRLRHLPGPPRGTPAG